MQNNKKLKTFLGSKDKVNQNLGIQLAKSLGWTTKEIAKFVLLLGKKFYHVSKEIDGYMWTRIFKNVHIDIWDDDDGKVSIDIQKYKSIDDETKTSHSFNDDDPKDFKKIINRLVDEIED